MNELFAGAIELGGRVFLAALIGVMISYRKHTDRHHQNILHSHAYLAMAGALFIMIIGDRFERAIGLIGVATIIRYRYAISNPKDAGTLIMALGLGMACGTGELRGLAVAGAIYIMIIVRLLDLLPTIAPSSLLVHHHETRLRLVTANPEATLTRLEEVLRRENVEYSLKSLERKRKVDMGLDSTLIEAQLRFTGDLDITRLTGDIADEYTLSIIWRETDPSTSTWQ